MKKLLIIILFILAPYSLVNAATLAVSSIPDDVKNGERFSVDIMLDPMGESVNSLEINLAFPNKLVSFAGYNNSDGNIPIWIQEPKEISPGIIKFSGVIPGGLEKLYDPEHPYNNSIRLIKLFFVAQNIGSGELLIQNSQLLKNDGKGSAVPVTFEPKSFVIKESSTISNQDNGDTNDKKSQESQTLDLHVSIVESSLFGRTPKLAVFDTKNSQSGVEHYEVKIDGGDFQVAKNPYPLPYRLFGYTLTIRAFDFAGNYEQQAIAVEGESPYGMWLFALLIVLVMVFYKYIFLKMRWKKRKNEASNNNNI